LKPRKTTLSAGDTKKLRRASTSIRKWAKAKGRKFPWRRPEASEFERICVEVLLQRTRAETVAKIYEPFFSRFQSWEDLAAAPVNELEGALKPIGLWRRRALSLKALATHVVSIQGNFPVEHGELLGIPGVGQYVANAIQLFRHGRAAPLLDTNMARIVERYIRPRKLADIRYDPWLQASAHQLVAGKKTIETNWGVLDFGALVCGPREPLCEACPLAPSCNYRRSKAKATRKRREI